MGPVDLGWRIRVSREILRTTTTRTLFWTGLSRPEVKGVTGKSHFDRPVRGTKGTYGSPRCVKVGICENPRGLVRSFVEVREYSNGGKVSWKGGEIGTYLRD